MHITDNTVFLLVDEINEKHREEQPDINGKYVLKFPGKI